MAQKGEVEDAQTLAACYRYHQFLDIHKKVEV